MFWGLQILEGGPVGFFFFFFFFFLRNIPAKKWRAQMHMNMLV